MDYMTFIQVAGTPTEDQLGAMMDELQAQNAIMSGGPGYPDWSVIFTIEADSPVSAHRVGEDVLARAAARVGIPWGGVLERWARTYED